MCQKARALLSGALLLLFEPCCWRTVKGLQGPASGEVIEV